MSTAIGPRRYRQEYPVYEGLDVPRYRVRIALAAMRRLIPQWGDERVPCGPVSNPGVLAGLRALVRAGTPAWWWEADDDVL